MLKKISLVLLLVLSSSLMIFAQRTVTGKIIDENGEALIGASILVKETSSGTVTDLDGSFSLSLTKENPVLIISYTGFTTQEVEVGTQTIIEVTMVSDIIGLEDVVVVGYGETSKRNKVQSISTINSASIENRPALGPQELLQGQAAGVQMVGASGALGAATSIRVRGPASINAGGNPLFVVDGVPLNDGTYSFGQGAVALNPLQDINPNDIESINILKDAAAAAIYGSRGSNGVILISTKKGKAGNNTITLDVYSGFSDATNRLEALNADQFRQFMVEYNGADPASLPTGSFDWPNAVARTGSVQSYSITASGGTDKTQYYLGGTYLDQEGFILGNDVSRANGRLNFKHTINERLRFGANVGISQLKNNRVNQDNSTFAPFTSSYLQLPYVDAFNPDGTFARTGFVANVLAIEEESIRDLVSRRTTANVFVKYDLIENLTLTTDFGIDNVQTEETIRDVDVVSPGGFGDKRIIQDLKYLNTTTLNYQNSFGKNSLNALIGISFETSRLDRTRVQGSNFAADALRNVASAATPTATFADRTRWALASQFLRLNYSLDNKYLLEGSLRRDGSSRFGSSNRYGIFWALGAGWVISDEEFMENAGFINFLKLSASYGTTGNDRIGNFASRGLYQGGLLSDYAGSPGIRPFQPENPDLKWEESTQIDIGISLAMFDSRLSIDANYYIKKTSDMLLNFQVPHTTGFTSITRNAAEMENKGIDLDISADIIRSKDFSWTTKLSVGFLSNEVTSLPDATVDAQGRRFIAGSANQRAIEGESVNSFYLIRYLGVNSQTGDAEWLDVNGNPTTSPTAADRVITGSAIPDFTGGFTNTLRFKNFDLNAFFSFSSGNDVFLGEFRFLDILNSGGFNKSIDVLNFWRQPGDVAFAPAADSQTKGTFRQRSTAQLFDGSFLRLKNVTLGYTLSGTGFGNGKVFKSIRLYAMGTNLLTFNSSDFRGADPEVSANGQNNLIQGESFFTPPQARTITFGARVTF